MKQKGNNGYLLVFFAGVLWGTIGLFVKQLQRCGASPMKRHSSGSFSPSS